MLNELKIGFLSSHGGSNMQAVIDACKQGRLNAVPSVLICNNSKSIAIERARNEKLAFYHISSKTHPENEDDAILNALLDHKADIVLLLGYMKKLGHKTLQHYKGKILNIHPSLLPKYGGKGMYGRYVHEAVLENNEVVTGITIHTVDEEYDKGRIINQCEIPILENDTVEMLTERVRLNELEFLIETLEQIISKKLTDYNSN